VALFSLNVPLPGSEAVVVVEYTCAKTTAAPEFNVFDVTTEFTYTFVDAAFEVILEFTSNLI
jgi:hypothetical protein